MKMKDRNTIVIEVEIAQIADAILQQLAEEDVVKVVRCKDCKHPVSYTSGGFNYRFCVINDRDVDENDFCSYGEKGEGE